MEDYKKEKRDIEDFINGTVQKLSPANKEKAVYIMQGMIIGQLASEQAEISKNMIDAVNQFNEVRLQFALTAQIKENLTERGNNHDTLDCCYRKLNFKSYRVLFDAKKKSPYMLGYILSFSILCFIQCTWQYFWIACSAYVFLS